MAQVIGHGGQFVKACAEAHEAIWPVPAHVTVLEHYLASAR
ncbi:hypothetical protein ABIE67_009524 [Streptomyces sp. V4I8]